MTPGMLLEGYPYSLIKDFLHSPIYKPTEIIKGKDNLGNPVTFKINKDPSRRGKNQKGNYSYKLSYYLLHLDKDINKSIFNKPSIIILNSSFLSYLDLYSCSSSFKGVKRSRIMPVKEVKEGYIGELPIKRELLPVYLDNHDLGIPKLRIDLDDEATLEDIFDKIYFLNDFIRFSFYRMDMPLGEILILEDNKPSMKIYIPSFSLEEGDMVKDEVSYIRFSSLIDKYDPHHGLNIPIYKGKRLILDKSDYLKELESLSFIYSSIFKLDIGKDIVTPIKKISSIFEIDDNPSVKELILEASKEVPSSRFYRELRKFNLAISLLKMGLSIYEVEVNLNRLFLNA